MSYSTARVLALLELLEAHGRMRGDALAERLEVDVRTIRRYVLTLRDRGIPVEMERGRYGGYYLPAGYKRPLALTEREALATAWALLSIGRQNGDTAGSDSQRALTKLSQSLARTTREMVRSLEHVVTFADAPSYGGGGEPIDIEHLKTILCAVTSRQRVHMTYHAWNGETTAREVDPYHVVYRAGRWYLVAYCHLRADQRVFRFDHILRIALLTDVFESPQIDALAAVEQSLAQVPWRWEYRVQVDLSLEEATRRIPATMARLEQGSTGVIMYGYADDLAWIAHFVAGLRCPLVVLSPEELRHELLLLAEHIRAISTQPVMIEG
jgi:predicted DNA-binding transcriptional regulator YafY